MGWEIHDLLSELLVFVPMQRLGEIVTCHIVCGTILDTDAALLLLIRNEEETNIEVSGSLASTLPAIGF